MSQKEQTVQKLSQLRTSLTSEGDEGMLFEEIDLDGGTSSRGGLIGEIVGRQLGGILGRRVGERFQDVFEEQFGDETAQVPIADSFADVFESSEETESSEEDENEAEEGEDDEADSDDREIEMDFSEMSTGDLQSLADQLMDELQQRNETE